MNEEAWKKVEAAIAASKDVTIKDLFAADPDRAAKYTVSAAGWMLDYSKNRIDAATMKALIKLAEASNLKDEIEKMFTGKKINATEGRAVLHTALRNCDPAAKVMVDGKDVMPEIRAVLDKCATVDEAIALFRSVDMRDVMGCCYHYQVCDASGATVLIEYVRNEMRLVYPSDPGYAGWLDGYAGEKPVQFVNNFYISTDADHSGDRGCRDTDIGGNRGRILANGLLASRGVMTEDMAMSLLAAARLDYQHPRRPWRVQTLWSAVYNLSERTVTICPALRYGEKYRFEVK